MAQNRIKHYLEYGILPRKSPGFWDEHRCFFVSHIYSVLHSLQKFVPAMISTSYRIKGDQFGPNSVGKNYFDGFGSKTLSYGTFYPLLHLSKTYKSTTFFTSDLLSHILWRNGLEARLFIWPKMGLTWSKKKVSWVKDTRTPFSFLSFDNEFRTTGESALARAIPSYH